MEQGLTSYVKERQRAARQEGDLYPGFKLSSERAETIFLAKRAALEAVTSLYGIPQLTPYFEESVGPENLAETSAPGMDEQKRRDAVRQQFDGVARLDQAGSSKEPVPGLTQS